METVKLGEVAQIVDCEHKTAPITPGGRFFAVGTPAMRGNFIDYSQARPISAETFQDWTKRLRPKVGDILFAREAPVGPVVQIPPAENIAPGQRTVLIRPGARIDGRYLFYLLASRQIQDHIKAIAAGSTVPHLNVSDIRRLCLGSLPRLITQYSIGEVLGSLDDKIAANNRVVSISNELVRARYSALPVSACSLRDIADLVRSSTPPHGFDPQKRLVGLEHFDSESLWLARSSTPDVATSAKNEFHAGDTLFGKLRPYFHKVAIAPFEGYCSTDVLVLRAKEQRLGPLVAAAANSDAVVQHAVNSSNGTRMPRAKWGDIETCQVPDPGDRRTAEFIRIADTLIQDATARLEANATLANTRDELLPLLMNGKISVREAEQEATSAGADIPSEEIGA